jgi:hypothetical protein
MANHFPVSFKKSFVVIPSFVIILFLLLQMGITLRIFPAVWPFENYPMFSSVHYDGESKEQWRIIGRLEDGREVSIKAQDLGLDIKLFNRQFLKALQDNNREAIENGVALYQRRQGRQLIEIRLENHPLRLSKGGWQPEAIQVVRTINFEHLKR